MGSGGCNGVGVATCVDVVGTTMGWGRKNTLIEQAFPRMSKDPLLCVQAYLKLSLECQAASFGSSGMLLDSLGPSWTPFGLLLKSIGDP